MQPGKDTMEGSSNSAEAPRAPQRPPDAADISRVAAGLIDLLPAGVTVCDAGGAIVQFNRKAAEFWGRVPAAGQSYAEFFAGHTLHHSDGRPMAPEEAPMVAALRRGVTTRNRVMLIRRPQGPPVRVLVNTEPVWEDAPDDTEGHAHEGHVREGHVREGHGRRVVGAVTVFHDIDDHPDARSVLLERESALLEREHELRESKETADRARAAAEAAREQAESANRAKDHFLAMLSHELRTPLTPVLATVTYVESRGDLPPELREEVAAIRRNVEMEARLIDDLLDLTRISRGKIELHHEVLDAHASLRAALEICQGEIEGKGIEVALALRAREHHVWADPARMQQVFMNLVSNAVKFTPDGGEIRLRSSNVQRDGVTRLVVQVSDTGVGIDPEALPRIFNAFEQGERTVTRRFGGLGLGLTISKTLVDMHHGHLRAESGGPGAGSTFTVELDTTVPASRSARQRSQAPSHATPRGQADPAACEAGGAEPARGLRILLVEDHEDTLRILARLLRGFGHVVTTAKMVRAALELVSTAARPFDVLISDLGLPDGSGLEIMRHVKRSPPPLCDLPGIALTGFGMEEDLRQSREAGFEQHLTKPVNFQTLERVIRKVAREPAAL